MTCSESAPSKAPLVLVVDDEQAFGDIVAQVLRDDGFRAALAQDGRQALDLIARETPDLVLLDLVMPVMSGQEVIEAMGQSSTLAKVPIIVLTGVTDPKLNRRVARVVSVMRKPVILHALVQKVETLLR